MARLTLEHFSRTGEQDCRNVFSFSDYDLRGSELLADSRAAATALVAAELDQWESSEWISQQDDFEGLDPVACFEAWRAEWKATAIEILTSKIAERRAAATCEVCGGVAEGNACCPDPYAAAICGVDAAARCARCDRPFLSASDGPNAADYAPSEVSGVCWSCLTPSERS
jgi:hypothetical protein